MLSDEQSRHAGRYYGKFRGVVTDDKDPDMRGTLQVSVPDVFGDGVIVPAEPCLPYGHFFVPPVDTHVWVEFEAGDPQRPIWVGVWHPEGTVPEEAQASPPEHRTIKTAAGHTIEIVDTEGEERILIRHASDAFLSIDQDGSILVANPKGSHLHLDAENGSVGLVEQHGNHLSQTEKGTALINPDGTMVNIAGDTVHLSAAKIILDATSVAAGHGAAEPTLMGNAFSILWDLVVTHVHPGIGAPAPTLAVAKLLPGVHLTSSVAVK
jgi:hypothetical protein